MKQRRWPQLLLAGAVALLVALVLSWWARLGTTSLRPLASGAYLLETSGPLGPIGANVVAVRGDAGVILVDTQQRSLGARIRNVVREHVGGPIVHVVITHWHPDHSGGIGAFSKTTPVVAHESVRRRLRELSQHGPDDLPQTGEAGETIDLGGRRAQLLHVAAAHTDGDTIVFFPEIDVVAVGDLIRPGSFPVIDVEGGGSAVGLEAALAQLVERVDDAVVIVPGHGAPIRKAALVRYHQMVSESVAWARVGGDPPEAWKTWESALVPASEWRRVLAAGR